MLALCSIFALYSIFAIFLRSYPRSTAFVYITFAAYRYTITFQTEFLRSDSLVGDGVATSPVGARLSSCAAVGAGGEPASEGNASELNFDDPSDPLRLRWQANFAACWMAPSPCLPASGVGWAHSAAARSIPCFSSGKCCFTCG